MPKYTYGCVECGVEEDITRSIHDPEGHYPCPKCGYMMARVYTPTPVQFKGGGFYSTGNRG